MIITSIIKRIQSQSGPVRVYDPKSQNQPLCRKKHSVTSDESACQNMGHQARFRTTFHEPPLYHRHQQAAKRRQLARLVTIKRSAKDVFTNRLLNNARQHHSFLDRHELLMACQSTLYCLISLLSLLSLVYSISCNQHLPTLASLKTEA